MKDKNEQSKIALINNLYNYIEQIDQPPGPAQKGFFSPLSSMQEIGMQTTAAYKLLLTIKNEAKIDNKELKIPEGLSSAVTKWTTIVDVDASEKKQLEFSDNDIQVLTQPPLADIIEKAPKDALPKSFADAEAKQEAEAKPSEGPRGS